MNGADLSAARPGAQDVESEDLLWQLGRTQSLAQIGSWRLDFETNLLTLSQETFNLFGLPVYMLDISYDGFLNRVHPDDRTALQDVLGLAAEEGAGFEIEHRILWPNNEIRFVRQYGEVECDLTGAPLRLRAIVQDVTRLRAIERSSTRNRDLLSGMFRISPEAIVVANEKGRIVIFSAGAEAVFGHAAHEIVGQGIERLMPERFRDNHGRHVAGFVEGELDNLQMAQRRAIRGLRKEGVEIPIAASVARIVAGGETLFMIIIRDLTDRYETETKLIEARDRAEQANKAKSDFLANMSHELRTPLNGILGVAEVLASSTANPRQKEMADLIAVSARALEVLLTDILDLSQIEAGRMEIQHRPFDLGVMVRNVAALFSTSAQSKGLSFEMELDESACSTFNGDEKRLRQVLNNLLSNAVKFTDAGLVKLSVFAVEGPSPAWVRFTVRDAGIGFDEETGARLFNRFEQADSSITRRFGGTGLGLSICKALVERMGGTIRAESCIGDGATFTFEIPLDATAAASVPTYNEPDLATVQAERPLRILLAEDHPVNRQVVGLILASLGVDLCSVENGALAVAEAAAKDFDLILMDIQMPVMDGLEAVRNIRLQAKHAGRARVPVYMLTANASHQFQAMAKEAGADDFLTKPISAPTLIAKVLALDAIVDERSELSTTSTQLVDS